jgi:hypothetical protein
VPGAFDAAGMRQHGAALADQVQRHVGQRDVFLQHRRVAGPFGDALAQDQRGVADAQQVLQLGAVAHLDGSLHGVPHMWSTEPGSL